MCSSSQKSARRHLPTDVANHKQRLAQSPVAIVDRCDCGAISLHMGAITVRLTSEAMTELLSTLGEAVATEAALRTVGRARLGTRGHA